MSMLVACLNGAHDPGAHPALPVAAAAIAEDARNAVEAGAAEVHVHPRDDAGRQSLHPGVVTEVVSAVRAATPGTPISLTTIASAEPDVERRLALLASWTVLPDSVTVNLNEAGSAELVRRFTARGVAVEAGLWTAADAESFVDSQLPQSCRRVLVEPMDGTVEDALVTADAVLATLDKVGVRLPRQLHGTGATAWPVLEAALERGLDVRMGLEDCFALPDGSPAPDNAALVRAAAERVTARAG